LSGNNENSTGNIPGYGADDDPTMTRAQNNALVEKITMKPQAVLHLHPQQLDDA